MTWICDYCSYENDDEREACLICGMFKEMDRASYMDEEDEENEEE